MTLRNRLCPVFCILKLPAILAIIAIHERKCLTLTVKQYLMKIAFEWNIEIKGEKSWERH